jgi:hypothetical protein
MTDRELNRRRIAWATRGLAGAAAVATAVFAGAAAHHTSEGAQAVTPATAVEDDDDSGFSLTPSTSAPSQTFSPSVATSAGS